MSTGTGPAKHRCAQCEQPEDSCQCERYCCLCQSVIDIRLCADGLLYCTPCREACDYKTSEYQTVPALKIKRRCIARYSSLFGCSLDSQRTFCRVEDGISA